MTGNRLIKPRNVYIEADREVTELRVSVNQEVPTEGDERQRLSRAEMLNRDIRDRHQDREKEKEKIVRHGARALPEIRDDDDRSAKASESEHRNAETETSMTEELTIEDVISHQLTDDAISHQLTDDALRRHRLRRRDIVRPSRATECQSAGIEATTIAELTRGGAISLRL